MANTYQFSNAGGTFVLRSDGALVAWDPADGRPVDIEGHAGQTWAEDGSPAPAAFVAPPAPVPQTISAMQAKVALSRAGLLTSVQTWVNSQSAETQLIWNSASSFDRGSALIASAAVALGLTSAQVDALFVTAAAINP